MYGIKRFFLFFAGLVFVMKRLRKHANFCLKWDLLWAKTHILMKKCNLLDFQECPMHVQLDFVTSFWNLYIGYFFSIILLVPKG